MGEVLPQGHFEFQVVPALDPLEVLAGHDHLGEAAGGRLQDGLELGEDAVGNRRDSETGDVEGGLVVAGRSQSRPLPVQDAELGTGQIRPLDVGVCSVLSKGHGRDGATACSAAVQWLVVLADSRIRVTPGVEATVPSSSCMGVVPGSTSCVTVGVTISTNRQAGSPQGTEICPDRNPRAVPGATPREPTPAPTHAPPDAAAAAAPCRAPAERPTCSARHTDPPAITLRMRHIAECLLWAPVRAAASRQPASPSPKERRSLDGCLAAHRVRVPSPLLVEFRRNNPSGRQRSGSATGTGEP